ncbi:hypothetical protein [Peredibacter starrii]|uniref:Uncharacterized protein n=1 Tax=Peredibacter starrii TaxID=28202 RepID=A0AAX4HMP2_9BACT|nr:hypothetical protein [Peredibacter starrii]WPU64540.1 hypothetical protein SOO65_17750 [Peredibacter starrii]
MKKVFFLAFSLLSLTAFAQGSRGPHKEDPEMKACFEELKSNGQLSEGCQELFQEKQERKKKIQKCIAAIDGDDVTDTSSSDDTTTVDDSESGTEDTTITE